MGKPEEVRVEVPDLAAGGGGIGPAGILRPCAAGIRRAFSARCLVVLVLSACVLLSAVFSLPPFLRHRSGFVPDDPDSLGAEIQASFILQKSISLLATDAARLEYDIFEEIGIPNTKVSIISMHPLASENSTYVVFGLLPDPKNASISSPALSILRSTLIDLVLKQINISLTSSVFGRPSSFELLKFPGGITVIPLQSASIWERAQILFDFKLNNTIEQILKNIDRLKDELKFGLNLTSFENVYVKLTNENGSTVAPPVTVQASVLSDIGSGSLLPDRMKQLAQVITGPDANNLGLNNSIFGKVKQVQLSSYLEHSISSLAPGPSPYTSPSPSPFASLNPSLPPAHSPSESPMAYAPTPKNGIHPHSEPANAPGPSWGNIDPFHKHYPCPTLAPNSGPPVHPFPPLSSDHSPSLASPPTHEAMGPTPKVNPAAHSPLSPAANDASSPVQDNGSGGRSSPAPVSSLISPSLTSKAATIMHWETKLTGLLGLLMFQIICGLH